MALSCSSLLLGKTLTLTYCLAAGLEGGLPGATGRGELHAKSLDISAVLAAALQSDACLTSVVEQQPHWNEAQFSSASLTEKVTSCCYLLLC